MPPSAEQLDGFSGGPRLKRETQNFGVVSKVNPKAVASLREVLGPTGVSLAVLVAQARDSVVYGPSASKRGLKFVGNVYDTCTDSFLMLLEALNGSDYEACLGGIDPEGLLSLGVSVDVVMAIVRPVQGMAMLDEEVGTSDCGATCSEDALCWVHR